MIQYVPLESIEDLHSVVTLEREIWQMDAIDLTPPHFLRMNIRNGGVVIGARDGDKTIGFVVGLPARKYDEWIIWSHIAGVSPAYQGQGIGRQLKLKQRDWALEHGFTQMRWTFDPLQRRNANFNLNILRAVGDVYVENVYGEINDTLNAGMKTDRLEAAWNLRDAHNDTAHESVLVEDGCILITYQDGQLVTLDFSDAEHLCFVEIPFDLTYQKKTNMPMLQKWQMHLRHTLQRAFASGYITDQFIVENDRCWYVLRPK